MKSITKLGQPEELIRWKAENAETPQNLVYGGSFPGEAVRKSLLNEQFHLCAYTLRRLKTAAECQIAEDDTRAACHIEHLLPQSRRVPGEDIDYQNMLACFPASQSAVACEFGAHAKAGFDPTNGGFVSPLSPTAEAHFEFDKYGGIQGTTVEGNSTIKLLKLNHKTLVNDRLAVIKGYLQPKGKNVSAQAARRLADEVLKPDAQRRLPAYCLAVAQTALQHAEREERRAARMK
jgi:uncharacterized protein (TIGR02646 family)